MLKIQQIFPKLYRCLLHVGFHNLEPQNAGLVDITKDLNLKDLREFLCAKTPKICIVIKNVKIRNVIWFEDTLMHKAASPMTFFQLF